MSKEIHWCEVCGTSYGVERHHIMFRSEVKALENCKLNYSYLCPEHHRGTFGVHGSRGAALNKKLKLNFQNELERSWLKEYLTKEEINDVLRISEIALTRLLKTIKVTKLGYERESVIRACLGGKLYEL